MDSNELERVLLAVGASSLLASSHVSKCPQVTDYTGLHEVKNLGQLTRPIKSCILYDKKLLIWTQTS